MSETDGSAAGKLAPPNAPKRRRDNQQGGVLSSRPWGKPFLVMRSGEDGAERWRRKVVRFVHEDNRFTQLPFIASGGEVVLIEPGHLTVEIVKLDALTGEETWRQRLDASGTSSTVWEVVATSHDLLMAWADGLVRLDPQTGGVTFRSFDALRRSGVAVTPSGKVAMTEEGWTADSDSVGFRVRTIRKHALRKELRQQQRSTFK